MGLRKGQTNNPKGRPKGTKSKATAELKERISSFLDGNFETLIRDFKKLEPKDRLMFYEKLLKYALPTMQSTKADIQLEKLSDEQLDIIINKLINDKNRP